MESKSIILFDGVCNLCNGFVNFVITRDAKNIFQFGSLQSKKAPELLRPFNFSTNQLSTVLLIEDGKLYSQSTAALRILKKLNGAWPLLYAFIIVPKPIRDLVYDFIAKNRYRWFGRKDECMIPTPELRAKFVD
ncbi:MAG: thiol-disulfide oxidoreductase DCC family protein [Cyclobacteriaceae bacterium]|nr:thiol-disulfide oxidoreductase DCC family protein [Cyclobacteriaceae bacterium]